STCKLSSFRGQGQGDRIKALRKKRGMTQEKLSEAAVIDYKYLQRLEGKKPPALKVDTIEKLAKALKVKPDEMLK
ncbi:MAG: helix-turn-helix transcriptional regulator, partial [Candidatus Omnitrophica bacterium]|nr:helix-turn-helix transcriptional regulator [Candidatus Omnitrophota bacterium]